MHAPGKSPARCRDDETCLSGMGEREKADSSKDPTGPALELSQVASGARTSGEMRGEGKIQQGIITEGAFCCP